jgi:hypothetical protein
MKSFYYNMYSHELNYFHFNVIKDQFSPQRRLDKLIFARLVKKIPAIYEIWMLITMFTRKRHWSVCWLYPEPHETCPRPHTTFIKANISIILTPICPCLTKRYFLFRSAQQNYSYNFILSSDRIISFIFHIIGSQNTTNSILIERWLSFWRNNTGCGCL